MENLPNEVLINIFQHLPQKYILVLSKVCKKWQSIMFQPLFLNTLNIFSIHHLKEYITMVNETIVSGTSIGQYVKRIYFHTERIVKGNLLIDIINTFPNLLGIHRINLLFSPSRSTISNLIPSLNQLEYFSFWHNGYDDQWMNIISNNQHKIKSLAFFLKLKLLVLDTDHHHHQQQQPSTLPILYFAPISPIKGTIYEYSYYTNPEHKIYTVKLPILSSLTYLCIDCMKRDGDERMFESIHQSCPQLKSLTLKSFQMHTSEDYIHKINNQLLKPYTSLKNLFISNLLNESTCFDYLSFKYPHLESLALFLGPRYNLHRSTSSLRSAIYHMITHYHFLKKLTISLDSEKYQYEIWPHGEFLEWLQQNPAQLTHLDYTYNLKNKIFNSNGDIFQEQYQIDSGMMPTSSSDFNSSFIFQPQQINYLNHLSSLSLGSRYSNTVHILYYFYLCNGKEDSVYLSYSIEELNLDYGHHGNIYFWLNAFPNLKALTIDGLDDARYITDYDINEYDDEFDNNNSLAYFEVIYPFFKKKMKRKQQQQQQTITHSTTSTSSIIANHSYKLRNIYINKCFIDFRKYGWNGFFKRCPYLKTISLNNINPWVITYCYGTIERHVQNVTFNLSHLSLELLKINNFIYKNHIDGFRQLHFVEQMWVKETFLNKSYFVGYDSEIKNFTFKDRYAFTLNIICKQINNIIFDQDLKST